MCEVLRNEGERKQCGGRHRSEPSIREIAGQPPSQGTREFGARMAQLL